MPAESIMPVETDLAGLAALVRSWTVELHARDGEGRGSAIVWHPDGLVVTNAHVVPQGRRPRLRTSDGTEIEAQVLVRDEKRDLALLEADASGFPAMPIGNPAALRPGSIVLAHGHPWGVAHALSLGVVHAISRDRRGAPRHIAADVRLAPGNSGGPLVDATGRVVGINAMIVGGLGVAIPVNVVERFIREAAASGALHFRTSWAA
jgi:serine protease Do